MRKRDKYQREHEEVCANFNIILAYYCLYQTRDEIRFFRAVFNIFLRGRDIFALNEIRFLLNEQRASSFHFRARHCENNKGEGLDIPS